MTPTSAALARLLAERPAAAALSQAEVDYVVDRLAGRGVYQSIHNWGEVRCLVPHEHGDGVYCVFAGPIFDRRPVRVYSSDELGIDELLRVARHATLQDNVQDLGSAYAWPVGTSSRTGLSGYRSVESHGPGDSEIVESFVDSLDGIKEDVVKIGVASFCRGVISDEEVSAYAQDTGRTKPTPVTGSLVDRISDWLVRRGVVSFCRTELSASASAELAKAELDKAAKVSGFTEDELSGWKADLFGPSSEAQARIEEVAAQWSTLHKKMMADPALFKLLAEPFDYWLGFWDRYQKKNDLDIAQLIVLSSSVRRVIAEVNMARANAEGKFVQDIAEQVKDIASEKTNEAQSTAQVVDDRVKEVGGCFSSVETLQKCIEELAAENKWKLIGAGILTAATGILVVKVIK